ncbi:Bax inhibitor-1/YccA family membrane protein [Demequina sp. SO4-13]|uniref:Bax inhibitor-1/YccA family protein n=1 Tax=Demequina sp. SO4-13 TaxID=3401027 RepID=UPI003AF99B47
MASPAFSTNSAFKPGATYDQNGKAVSAADLDHQFGQPVAGPGDTGRMSYEGVISKTAGMVVLAGLLAIPGYMFPSLLLTIAAGVIGFVLSLVLIFKKVTPPALAIAYAAVEGYFLGGITTYIETAFEAPGAGLQALIATACTFAVCLWLYHSGRVRYTPKMQKFLLIGGISYIAFSLVNVGMMIFGGTDSAWGLRTEIEIFGIPLGVLIGAFAIILACVSLIGDFDFIENGVKNGLPAHFDWKAAFGIVLTLVWLYIEFLRIIAILQGRE